MALLRNSYSALISLIMVWGVEFRVWGSGLGGLGFGLIVYGHPDMP